MNYGSAIDYLLFQHDEITMKPILDDQGQLQLRDEYYIDGILCDPMFFEKDCDHLNKKYHKNYRYDEIKLHHYIISFDPSDKTEHGLTGEKAQTLGLEFTKKNFPGHQALVVTHTDGHNHSSNIHVHIVINSLRKETVEKQDFMERSYDNKAGYKHHQTKAYLKHMQKSLMDICQREGLHQIDLLKPAALKITNEEYWAKRKGQKKLDALNKEIVDDGLTPTNTVFKTQKQHLRDAINDIAEKVHSFQEFQEQLFKKYQITVTENRGRYSYQISGRDKHITERALGTNYGKAYLEANFGRVRTAEMHTDRPMEPYNPAYDYEADPVAVFYIKSNLRLVVNLQTCAKAQLNVAYARKVKISNLKEMAETVLYCLEHGHDTRADMQNHFSEITAEKKKAKTALDAVSAELKMTNMQLKHVGSYYANKRVYQQMSKVFNKKKYRQDHAIELAAYQTSKDWLEANFPDQPLPTIAEIREKKAGLENRKEKLLKNYEYYRDYEKDLRTVMANVDAILDVKTVGRQRERDVEVL